MFCSWGAEEYGLVGSTEWVQVMWYFSPKWDFNENQRKVFETTTKRTGSYVEYLVVFAISCGWLWYT